MDYSSDDEPIPVFTQEELDAGRAWLKNREAARMPTLVLIEREKHLKRHENRLLHVAEQLRSRDETVQRQVREARRQLTVARRRERSATAHIAKSAEMKQRCESLERQCQSLETALKFYQAQVVHLTMQVDQARAATTTDVSSSVEIQSAAMPPVVVVTKKSKR